METLRQPCGNLIGVAMELDHNLKPQTLITEPANQPSIWLMLRSLGWGRSYRYHYKGDGGEVCRERYRDAFPIPI